MLLGTTRAWDAQVTNDEPARLIAWRRTQGAFFAPCGGSVRFEPKRHGRETMVQLPHVQKQARWLHQSCNDPLRIFPNRMTGKGPVKVVRSHSRFSWEEIDVWLKAYKL
jgi:hypothetical protein